MTGHIGKTCTSSSSTPSQLMASPTRELLTERDSAGEVVYWLMTIAEMASFS